MSSEALPRVVPELLHSKHSSVSKCFFQWSPLVFVVRFRVEFQITKRSVLVTWLRCVGWGSTGSASWLGMLELDMFLDVSEEN